MLKNAKIRTKLNFGFGLLIVVIIITTSVSFRAFSELSSLEEQLVYVNLKKMK